MGSTAAHESTSLHLEGMKPLLAIEAIGAQASDFQMLGLAPPGDTGSWALMPGGMEKRMRIIPHLQGEGGIYHEILSGNRQKGTLD